MQRPAAAGRQHVVGGSGQQRMCKPHPLALEQQHAGLERRVEAAVCADQPQRRLRQRGHGRQRLRGLARERSEPVAKEATEVGRHRQLVPGASEPPRSRSAVCVEREERLPPARSWTRQRRPRTTTESLAQKPASPRSSTPHSDQVARIVDDRLSSVDSAVPARGHRPVPGGGRSANPTAALPRWVEPLHVVDGEENLSPARPHAAPRAAYRIARDPAALPTRPRAAGRSRAAAAAAPAASTSSDARWRSASPAKESLLGLGGPGLQHLVAPPPAAATPPATRPSSRFRPRRRARAPSRFTHPVEERRETHGSPVSPRRSPDMAGQQGETEHRTGAARREEPPPERPGTNARRGEGKPEPAACADPAQSPERASGSPSGAGRARLVGRPEVTTRRPEARRRHPVPRRGAARRGVTAKRRV
jgi:hypothetical protein